QRDRGPPPLPSFPTRRSSDLARQSSVHDRGADKRLASRAVCALAKNNHHQRHFQNNGCGSESLTDHWHWLPVPLSGVPVRSPESDRKSTRLNSSHVKISYAVF